MASEPTPWKECPQRKSTGRCDCSGAPCPDGDCDFAAAHWRGVDEELKPWVNMVMKLSAGFHVSVIDAVFDEYQRQGRAMVAEHKKATTPKEDTNAGSQGVVGTDTNKGGHREEA